MSPRAAALIVRALDPDVENPDDPVSDRVLDAALALAAASGVRHVTIDDVARRAGVGRMTVYRRFGHRAGMIEALAVRECRRALAELAAVIDLGMKVEERVAEGFVAALRVAREHPLLQRLARVEPEAVLSTLTADDGRVLNLIRTFLAEQIRDGQRRGELRAGDPNRPAELLLRIGVSYVMMPDGAIALEDDDVARDVARSLIAPILV